MKQWLAVFAAVTFLALPIMGSASEETRIPPEATWWSPTPAATGVVAESPNRVVSTEQAQASDILRPAALQMSDQDAQYQMVNSTLHDE